MLSLLTLRMSSRRFLVSLLSHDTLIVDEHGNEDLNKDYEIPKIFEEAFAEPAQFEKVSPCRILLTKISRLDTLSPQSLKTGKLVRFLGMVQDTSYSQEIYVGMQKTGSVRSHLTCTNQRNGHSFATEKCR